MKVIDFGNYNINNVDFSNILISIMNITHKNSDEFIINLFNSSIDKDIIIIIEKFILPIKNLKYLSIVASPLSNYDIIDVINNKNKKYLDKLIWIKEDNVKNGAWKNLIFSETKRNIISNTHVLFYSKYKNLCSFLTGSGFQSVLRFDTALKKRYLLCKYCNFSCLLFENFDKHNIKCKSHHINIIEEIDYDYNNHDPYLDSDHIESICDHNIKVKNIYKKLYDNFLADFLNENDIIILKVNLGFISNKQLLQLFLQNKTELDDCKKQLHSSTK